MANKIFRLVILAGLLAAVFGLTGCTTFKATGLQMGLMIDGRVYERVGYFSEEMWAHKFLGWPFITYSGTLFNLSSNATDPKVRALIETNIRKFGGDGAIDVEIRYGLNALQYIISAITFGTWMPGTVTVTGTVVKSVK
jgi:hypothetical protein